MARAEHIKNWGPFCWGKSSTPSAAQVLYFKCEPFLLRTRFVESSGSHVWLWLSGTGLCKCGFLITLLKTTCVCMEGVGSFKKKKKKKQACDFIWWCITHYLYGYLYFLLQHSFPVFCSHQSHSSFLGALDSILKHLLGYLGSHLC